LTGGLSAQSTRDLWRDYDEGWHGMAETFGLSIDQWYHALGNKDPESVYWRHRGFGPDLDIQERTFDVLLNTAVTPNLMQVMTGAPLQGPGPLARALDRAEPAPLTEDTPLRLSDDVQVRDTVALDVPGFKAFVPAAPFDDDVDEETKQAYARYWADPVANGHVAMSPVAAPVQARRFSFRDRPEAEEVRALDREGADELLRLLQEDRVSERQLQDKLTPTQSQLLKRLVRAGMVVAEDHAHHDGQ
jgi:hypothetical protein